mgnify:CR=1 FL=1
MQPGQIWLKRVVAEMGGKDAIIVDDEADLDAAALGVAQRAFGFQGQKCSACSRAIVSETGATTRSSTKLAADGRADHESASPTSSARTWGRSSTRARDERILEYIETGKQEGSADRGRRHAWPGEDGWFVQPTVIADVDARRDDRAGGDLRPGAGRDPAPRTTTTRCAIANGTEYGLTGAVYTKNPAKIERARREFFVGNLYINRKCTGAMVGCHPFGGFNMSGTDSQGRRPRLPAAVPAGEERGGEAGLSGYRPRRATSVGPAVVRPPLTGTSAFDLPQRAPRRRGRLARTARREARRPATSRRCHPAGSNG